MKTPAFLNLMIASLTALGSVSPHDLARRFPLQAFREGLKLLARGHFDFLYFDRSFEGRVNAVVAVTNHRVTLRPKSFALPVADALFDCFTVICSCGEKGLCPHMACAGMVLCKAAKGSDTGLMGEAVAQLQKVRKEFAEFFGDALPGPVAGEGKASVTRKATDPLLQAVHVCVDEEPLNLPGQGLPALPAYAAIDPALLQYESPYVDSNDWACAPYCYRPVNSVGPLHLKGHSFFDLHYVFSDGVCLTSHELIYHPYARFVPLGWFPSFKGKVAPSPFVPPGDHQYRGKAELLRALQAIAGHGQAPPLYLAAGGDRATPRRAVKLESVHFIAEPSAPESWAFLQASLCSYAVPGPANRGHARLSVSVGPKGVHPSTERVVFPHFLVDSGRRTLIFHPHGDLLYALRECLGREFMIPWQGERIIKLDGHENIHDRVADIREDPRLSRLDLCIKPQSTVIPEDKVTPVLSVQGDGSFGFKVVVGCGNKPLDVVNPGRHALQLMESFIQGMGAFLPEDRAYYASQGKKRPHDLRLLGHLGIYGLLILETCSFILDGTDAEGAPVKDAREFEKKTFAKLALCLAGNREGTGETPELQKLVSQNTFHAVRDWIRLQIKRAGDPLGIYTPDGQFLIHGHYRVFLRVLQSLLRMRAALTKGACFEKQRVPVLPYQIRETACLAVATHGATRPTPLAFSGIGALEMLQVFLPLRSRGFEVLYEGTPLESLGQNDFKAEFKLDEKPADDGGEAIDWFELHPRFFLNGQEVELKQVQKMRRTGILEWQGKFYLLEDKNLPSIKYLERFWQRMGGVGLEASAMAGSAVYPLPKNQTLEILLLRAQGVPITGKARWQEICRFYDALSAEREPLAIPGTVHAELKPYQKDGIGWLCDLYQLRLGGILADDMGLGKTLQTLTFLEILRGRDGMGHALIVVPTSLTCNWLSESQKFTPELPLRIFNPKEKEDVAAFLLENKHAGLICTYGLFVEHADFFRRFSWNIHAYDEAQHLKNITALRTHTCRSIPARFKLCLTGTPLENHLGEFYSLADLVVPGCLGPVEEFRKTFMNAPDPRETAALRLKIMPLILRRTKDKILKELPPKTESVVTLPFEDRQKKIYRDIAISWNSKVKASITEHGEAKSQMMMLTALLRLRQACSDPASLPEIKYPGEPPKVALLIESLQEIVESGQSALVFTQFLQTFERIKRLLAENQIPSFAMNGSSSHADRKRALGDFKTHPSGAVMLMTLKTGGMGLNLVKATYVFHVEPWWNPAVENQATDRTHRIGQTQSVTVYRYLMQDSVEEKIEILKKRKSRHFEDMFGNAENEPDLTPRSSRLTREDFDYLVES